MYESPINILVNDIADNMIKQQEEQLMIEIKRTVGYVIDKEALIRAMQYDRGQYEKGYMDGVKDTRKTGYWRDENETEIDAMYGKHKYKCSECNKYADYYISGTEDWWDNKKPNYCPHCGAKMESEEQKCSE